MSPKVAFCVRLRNRLRAFLAEVIKECDGEEQTTHGRIDPGSTLPDVTRAIETAMFSPSAFNVSELAQVVDAYLTSTNPPERGFIS